MASMDRETYEDLMSNVDKGGSSWDGSVMQRVLAEYERGEIESFGIHRDLPRPFGYSRRAEDSQPVDVRVYDLETAKAMEAKLEQAAADLRILQVTLEACYPVRATFDALKAGVDAALARLEGE